VHEKSFGKITFSLTLHERVARIAVPLHDKYVVLISADKDADHMDLIRHDIFPTLQSQN
jgi:hypothetical protein